ncbi:MAG: type II toxin-antitoxin system VapC family toxin [Armatimonadota bacterium]|nr:type II toxin-antitoxin system VapC family toxin [Armatimonadota bacterium]MDR7449975.1 type II toxin-antitoxin system VapC family toxin [Armatimonadota bacterium]MDR7459328.1 type II toxin-antitoxin system VapC family toxin [Armatimonadota bacterium]MDR7479476.1 type II toxin-antitoxin system VapC family toxin [Armatimonadota bacterium]MDR7488194.1 type II toxin-antitoxin system VapC family toxin [Armatimonadota bacterium]
MILLDMNVLVYAHRADAPDHARYRAWLEEVLASPSPYGIAELVLSGFLRVVTHPRVFRTPTPMARALKFVQALRERPNCVLLAPRPRHWEIFVDLCRRTAVRGNLVPDAYFAALAIESGCEWITTDRDYSRFPGLTWRHPLDA